MEAVKGDPYHQPMLRAGKLTSEGYASSGRGGYDVMYLKLHLHEIFLFSFFALIKHI
jgi:hypothetical protein